MAPDSRISSHNRDHRQSGSDVHTHNDSGVPSRHRHVVTSWNANCAPSCSRSQAGSAGSTSPRRNFRANSWSEFCHECNNPHDKVTVGIDSHDWAPTTGLLMLRHPRPPGRLRNRAGVTCAFRTPAAHAYAVCDHHNDNHHSPTGRPRHEHGNRDSGTSGFAAGSCLGATRAEPHMDSRILDLAKRPL